MLDRRTAEVDPEDIFGLRRAQALLPQRYWDEFFDRWAALTEYAGSDIVALREAVVAEAEGPAEAALFSAWGIVGSAMDTYLTWRSGTR